MAPESYASRLPVVSCRLSDGGLGVAQALAVVQGVLVDRYEIPLVVAGAERELQQAPRLADNRFAIRRLRRRKQPGASRARDDLTNAEPVIAAAVRIEQRERREEMFVPVRDHIDAVLVEDVPQPLHPQRGERARRKKRPVKVREAALRRMQPQIGIEPIELRRAKRIWKLAVERDDVPAAAIVRIVAKPLG